MAGAAPRKFTHEKTLDLNFYNLIDIINLLNIYDKECLLFYLFLNALAFVYFEKTFTITIQTQWNTEDFLSSRQCTYFNEFFFSFFLFFASPLLTLTCAASAYLLLPSSKPHHGFYLPSAKSSSVTFSKVIYLHLNTKNILILKRVSYKLTRTDYAIIFLFSPFIYTQFSFPYRNIFIREGGLNLKNRQKNRTKRM